MKRTGKKTRRSNAGIGYNFDFHGAFSKKSDAAKKEAATPGAFIRPVYYRQGMRYAVLTRAKNPKQPSQIKLFEKVRAERIKAGDSPAVASMKALEAVHKWEQEHTFRLKRANPKRKPIEGSGLRYIRASQLTPLAIRLEKKFLEKLRREADKNPFGLDRFLGRKPRVTSVDWRRAGEARRRKALKSAGVPAKLLPVYVTYEWPDLQAVDPAFVTKVMKGLSRTYQKNPRRRVVASVKRRVKRPVRRNPDHRRKAAKVYEMFHGRKPRQVTERRVPVQGLPKDADFAKLGDVVELHTAEGVISFKQGERPMVVTDPAAKRLYFVGGNQDLGQVPVVRRANPGKGLDDLGDCTRIVYYSRKKFTDFKPVEWDHEFGEEGGQRPRLMFDRKRKQMHLVGGDYKIKDVGIVN